MKTVKVGIAGAAGYTGCELIRLLAMHPHAEISWLMTGKTNEGRRLHEVFPHLRGVPDRVFQALEPASAQGVDLVFLATPHGVAVSIVPEFLEAGCRVIDVSADYRLKDPKLYEEWYEKKHTAPELLKEAVYGLTELHRSALPGARIVANPGCYPTASQLGFLPLVENGLIDTDHLVADCKSGVSGAGRGANVDFLFSEVADSMKAYGVAGHRHLPEISQGLALAAGKPVGLTFVPHLTPMIRGIHATLYGKLIKDADLQLLYESRYQAEPFVDVMPAGSHPETRSVRSTNTCRIAVHRPQDGDTVVILSVIDNLVKGAAGQAVQNMNIMFGLDETAGIGRPGLLP